MRLKTISFSKYKCFDEKHTLDLEPLTVFFGRNGSGKSAAISAIPLFLQSCIHSRPGLPLKVGNTSSVPEFISYIHGYRKHGYLGLGGTFEDGDIELNIWVHVQNLFTETQRTPVISCLEMTVSTGRQYVLEWLPDEASTDAEKGCADYNLTTPDGSTQKVRVTFNGIWPVSSEDARFAKELKDLDNWRQGIKKMNSQLVHLKALRPSQPETVTRQIPAPTDIGPDGEMALSFLEAHEKYHKPVSEWFQQEDVGGWRFEYVEHGLQAFQLRMSKGNLSAPLNRVGNGLNQVFPIVVQRCLEDKGSIDIIEEPESHLHVSAHGALADLFIPTSENYKGLILTETHSEMFLLRLRRRVAEGKPGTKQLAIYWVDDGEEDPYIVRINLTRSGELENWPEDVFLEDYEELLALRRATTKNEAQ